MVLYVVSSQYDAEIFGSRRRDFYPSVVRERQRLTSLSCCHCSAISRWWVGQCSETVPASQPPARRRSRTCHTRPVTEPPRGFGEGRISASTSCAFTHSWNWSTAFSCSSHRRFLVHWPLNSQLHHPIEAVTRSFRNGIDRAGHFLRKVVAIRREVVRIKEWAQLRRGRSDATVAPILSQAASQGARKTKARGIPSNTGSGSVAVTLL